MNKYTAEQVLYAAQLEEDTYDGDLIIVQYLRDYADLLRERESAKAVVTAQIRATACDTYNEEMEGHGEPANPVAMRAALEAVAPMLASARVPDETRGTYACPICGKEYPHYHPEDTSRVNWHSDYRKVFEDIISANVRLYKDGVSIAPTNYSHESKLTVAGIAGHWFAYGAEDARSFGRESKGTDSAAWSEFASNGDGYAYAWMDSLWSLFKQTVVALKGREAVAPMLASARVPDGNCSGVRTCAHCGKPKMNCDCHDTSGFRMLPGVAGVSRMWDNEKAVLVSFERKPTDDALRALHAMLAAAPKSETEE